jgi:hypothetical protein
MPFQGNSNAGAPDPAFLNFLFNRQDARAKAERQAGLDKAKAREAEMDNTRKAQLHLMALRQGEQAIEKADAERSSRLADQATAGAQEGERNVQAQHQVELDQSLEEGPLGQANFAQILAQNGQSDPSLLGIQQGPADAIRQDALEPFNRANAGVAEQRGVTEEQNISDIFSRAGANEVAADRELAAKVAEEGRATRAARATAVITGDATEVRAIAKDKRLNEAIANRVTDEVRATNRAITKEREKLEAAKTNKKRDEISRNIAGLENRITQKENATLSGAAVKFKEDNFRKRDEHRSNVRMRQIVRQMISRPDLLGPRANISQVVRNLGGLASELTGRSEDFALDFAESKDFTKDQKELINTIFVMGKDPDTGEDIQRIRLEELRLVWVIENINNPNGRTAIREIENIRKTIGFSGAFVSAEMAASTLGGIEGLLTDSIKRGMRGLTDRDNKITFDDDDNITGDNFEDSNAFGSTPVNEPGTVDESFLAPKDTEAHKLQMKAAQDLIDRGLGG